MQLRVLRFGFLQDGNVGSASLLFAEVEKNSNGLRAQFFALGASIKDLGDKLSVLNKVEDPANVTRLRTEFHTIWASATPL